MSTFTLTGLDPGETYDVLIYGARSNNGGADSEWTFTDNSGETMEVGCVEFGIAPIVVDPADTEVVGHDEDDVGFLLLG